jgi:predicted GNAT family acetyltransferase
MAEPLTVVMNQATSRFEVSLDGEVAFAEYRLHSGYITLPHTVVPPAFEGKGVGSALAKAALGYAREHGLLVKPVCPFIARYIGKHPEWQDLVHPDFRDRVGLPG